MIENLKKALDQVTENLDFKLTWWQLSENLKVSVNDVESNDWDIPENFEAKNFGLQIQFYDEWYEIGLSKNNIDRNSNSFSYIQSLGRGSLLDSLEIQLEDDYWEHIKLLCIKAEELEKQEELIH